MSSILDRSTWEQLFPLNAPTPVTAVHHGIEYPGQVIRAGQWSSSLGDTPEDGCFFRIILLPDAPRGRHPEIASQKTAICVPESGSRQQVHRIIGEITASKQAAYLTRRDVDAAAINSGLRERRYDLENQLISEESARFSKGIILVHGGQGPEANAVFTGDEPVQWVQRLANWLLSRSFPDLPLDAQTLSQPVRADDAGRLFASIFNQTTAEPRLLRELGPALGISSSERGGHFMPLDSPVFRLIRERIGGNQSLFAEVHGFLAYDVGLTSDLATLFLLLFVHNEIPEHQIQLNDGAIVELADGGTLLGTRLTPDLIPLLAWEPNWASNAATIGPMLAASMTDARHHLSVLCPDISSYNLDTVNEALTRAVESIGRDLVTASRILDNLEVHWFGGGDSSNEVNELKTKLERLGRISGTGYADLYNSVRSTYNSLPDLKSDLVTLRQLVELDEDSLEIFHAQRYISLAVVPSVKFPNLAVDREALLTGLSPSRLTRSRGRGWSAIVRDAEGFKIRYTLAYREHHRRFHDELPVFQSELFTARKKLAALRQLDTIRELSGAPESRLEIDLDSFSPGPVPCSYQGGELDLSVDPQCSECQITLEQSVPSAELAKLAPRIDMALAGKTQLLSKLLVTKALTGTAHERWQEFLQIVQASELSSLANTLDDDLVSFIKQVLD